MKNPPLRLVASTLAALCCGAVSLVASALPSTSPGSLDPSFGNGGMVFDNPRLNALDEGVGGGLVQPDGRVVISGSIEREDGGNSIHIARFMDDGSPDLSFGGTGHVTLAIDQDSYADFARPAMDAAGRIFVTGGAKPDTMYRCYVAAFRQDGSLDPSFGTGGVARAQAAPGVGSDCINVVVQPDGKLLTLARTGQPTNATYVMRFNANGTPDQNFGQGGIAKMPIAGTQATYAIAVAADGSIYTAGATLGGIYKGYVVRFTPSGIVDKSFGTDGVAPAPFTNTFYHAVRPLADGTVLVSGFHGTLDSSFGDGGLAAPTLGTTDSLRSLALGPDGKIWLTGIADTSATDSAFAIARLVADEIKTPVIEFHNSVLDHYFITADPTEASAIDAGAAGPGWSRTGLSFKSGGPNKAGRFYGNPDVNPATGARRGPNSHFYSLESAEIAQVKTDLGWRFESYDFNAWPRLDGTCPAGTSEVLRAYNKRFAQNDSNHRYTKNPEAYAQMLAAGWSGEGAVFCATL